MDVYDFNTDDEDFSSSEFKKNISESGIEKTIQSDEINELDFEFIVGEKKNSQLIVTKHDLNIYSINGFCKMGTRYRCRDRKCRAYVIYCAQKKKVFKLQKSPPHKHFTPDNDYWNLFALQQMREKCANLTALAGGKRLASVRSIFTSVKKEYPRCTLEYRNIQKTLERVKSGVLPKNPISVSQIHESFQNPEILKSFGFTFGDDKPFFDTAVETEQFSYCVFSSKSIIKMAEDNISIGNRHVLMDATFRTCPLGPFNQLLILYIRKHHMVSFFFFLSFSLLIF